MLGIVSGILLVVRDELRGLLGPAGNIVLNEFEEVQSYHFVGEVKVNSSINLLDIKTLLVHFMLQNKLLQKQKCPLVRHFLTDLDLSLPFVRRVGLFARVALEVLDPKLNRKTTLQLKTILRNLPLNSDLDLNDFRVRLCPNKARVHQLHVLREALDLLEAVGHHLRALHFHEGPRRLSPPITLLAVVQYHILGDASCHINLALQAVDACITHIGLRHDSALAASGFLRRKKRLILHNTIARHALPKIIHRILHRRLAAYLLKFIIKGALAGERSPLITILVESIRLVGRVEVRHSVCLSDGGVGIAGLVRWLVCVWIGIHLD